MRERENKRARERERERDRFPFHESSLLSGLHPTPSSALRSLQNRSEERRVGKEC